MFLQPPLGSCHSNRKEKFFNSSDLAGDTPSPNPSRCVWSKFSVFNALEGGLYRKPFVLSNMKAKFLKQKNLRGRLREMGPGARPRV